MASRHTSLRTPARSSTRIKRSRDQTIAVKIYFWVRPRAVRRLLGWWMIAARSNVRRSLATDVLPSKWAINRIHFEPSPCCVHQARRR